MFHSLKLTFKKFFDIIKRKRSFDKWNFYQMNK
nr:MAG TPA: hypothetical protein [Caudoviricetes sp.]